MRRLTIVGVCLALFPVICNAQQTYFYDTGAAIFSYNLLSKKKNGNKASMWDEVVFKEPRRAANGRLYYTLKTLKLYDCSENTYAVTSLVMWDENGNVVNNEDLGRIPQKMESVVPGSVVEQTFRVACK